MASVGLCECGCGGQTTIAAYDHKARGAIKGQPRRFIIGHNGRKPVVTDYRKLQTAAGRVRLHIVRAERALGKTLPPKAVVHHADGTKGDDAPLVICQDQAFHMLLHARLRVKAAGGDPNVDSICGRCRNVKPREAFSKRSGTPFGVSTVCRQCASSIASEQFSKRKQARGAYWRAVRV